MSFPAPHRALCLTAVVAALVGSASAQCLEASLGTLVGHGDDSPLQAVQPLGITFPFAGATYTDVHISNNGMVYLSNASLPAPGTGTGYSSSATTLSSNLRSGAQAKIAVFWDDLDNIVSNGGGVMIDSTLGDRCVITWDNAVEFAQSDLKDLQLVLWDTGAIDFIYNVSCTVQTGSCLIGCGVGGAADPGQTDLSAGVSSTVATVYEVFGSGGVPFDLGGQGFRFSPNVAGGFDVGSFCAPAAHESVGVGCGGQQRSFYEAFSGVGANDLAGTTVTAVENDNGGYDGSSAPLSTYVVPTSVGLALGDETQSGAQALGFTWEYPGGSTGSVVIESNGRVLLNGTDTSDFSPSPGELLNDAVEQIAVSWADLLPDGASNVDNVFFETDNVGEARITWVNVPHFSSVNGAIDVQLVLLHTAAPGGDSFELRYQRVLGDAAHLVGFSTGNGAMDSGSSDLNGAAFSSGVDVGHVVLSAAPAPVLGTAVVMISDNMPASTALALNVIGVSPSVAGIELLPGAPGCFVYLNLIGGEVIQMMTVLPSDAVTLTLPVDPFFIGLEYYSQTACFAGGVNPLALVTSNAIKGTINSF